MGGFTVNGCGATDRFYHLKSLSSLFCPKCGKETEFHLDEVKRKIDVIFIPTATISVKYAIMCDKCKQGWYVSDTDKNDILSDRVTVKLSAEGVSLIRKEIKSTTVKKTTSKETTFKNTADIESKDDPAPIPVQEDNLTKSFAVKIDASYVLPKKKYCPKCNMFYVAQKEKCTVCGSDLIEK